MGGTEPIRYWITPTMLSTSWLFDNRDLQFQIHSEDFQLWYFLESVVRVKRMGCSYSHEKMWEWEKRGLISITKA
jgi:hypothetical protein